MSRFTLGRMDFGTSASMAFWMLRPGIMSAAAACWLRISHGMTQSLRVRGAAAYFDPTDAVIWAHPMLSRGVTFTSTPLRVVKLDVTERLPPSGFCPGAQTYHVAPSQSVLLSISV